MAAGDFSDYSEINKDFCNFRGPSAVPDVNLTGGSKALRANSLSAPSTEFIRRNTDFLHPEHGFNWSEQRNKRSPEEE
jgi:hypothetical protein